jgi:hypothetical protein
MGDQASPQVLEELQLLARLLHYLGKYGQGQWLGGFLGITSGWDPSVCKSNQHPNVRGEPVFSVMAADWFGEKSGWIGNVEDVKPLL